MEFTKSNLWEIKKSGSLKALGGLLALAHLLLFYVWWTEGQLPLKFVRQSVPVCWSLIENCHWLRIIPFGFLNASFYSYAAVSALAALTLLISDWVGLGFNLLIAALFLGSLLYFQDLRLSSNDGYFVLLMTFAYLFVPSKHRLMRWLIVSFFVAAGLSQASPEWLTGSWYMSHVSLPIKLAEWLAAMSVVIQMIGGAALLFRDGRYFFSGWLTLLVFECYQLYVGDFFSACLALGALIYVALDEFEPRKAEREYIYQSFIRPEPSIMWGGLLIALFWAAQITPFVKFDRASGLHRVLSIWALQPKAAREQCEQKTFAFFKGRTEEVTVEPEISRQPSMYCNPYLRFLDLKSLCRQLSKSDPQFLTLGSVLQIHSLRTRSSYRAFEVRDFCDPHLTYAKLSEVRWTTNPAK